MSTVERLREAGLQVRIGGDDYDGLCWYWPPDVFTVDGIEYDITSGRGVGCTRSIISLIDPLNVGENDTPSRQEWGHPPTENELDLWVAYGVLP